MKTFLLKSFLACDETWCAYALVEIKDELIKEIAAVRKAFLTVKGLHDNLYEMYLWDGLATFYTSHAFLDLEERLTESQLKTLEDGVPLEVTEGFKLDEDHIDRTECDQMIIREDGVAWYCIPKHSDTTATTALIPYETLFKDVM